MAKGSACCDDSCCDANGCGDGYAADELASLGLDASASLGCGNPTLLADLRPGEVVLDLGSGAGLDVLLSARRVAPDGHAYGVDMTDEMLAVARANQTKSGLGNATFLKGTIESVRVGRCRDLELRHQSRRGQGRGTARSVPRAKA